MNVHDIIDLIGYHVVDGLPLTERAHALVAIHEATSGMLADVTTGLEELVRDAIVSAQRGLVLADLG